MSNTFTVYDERFKQLLYKISNQMLIEFPTRTTVRVFDFKVVSNCSRMGTMNILYQYFDLKGGDVFYRLMRIPDTYFKPMYFKNALGNRLKAVIKIWQHPETDADEFTEHQWSATILDRLRVVFNLTQDEYLDFEGRYYKC